MGEVATIKSLPLDHKMHEKMFHHLSQSEFNTKASKEVEDKYGKLGDGSEAGSDRGDSIFNDVFKALQNLNDAVQAGVQQDGNLLNAEQASISAQEDQISQLNAQYKTYIFQQSDVSDGVDGPELTDQSFNTQLQSKVMEIQSVQNCESSDISAKQQTIESKASAIQQNQSEEADMIRQVQQTMMSVVAA